MGYDEFILIVNSSSVIILLMMALLLCSVSKFKGESSYAALFIVLTTVPVYIYNVCRSLGWYKVALFLAPLGFSVNLTLMPLLWLLVQRGFNPLFRLKPLQLLHFIPAVISLSLFCRSVFSLPESQWHDFMIHENAGDDTWMGDVNYLMLLAQVIGYFFVMFRYLHRAKNFVKDYYSEAELMRKMWIPRLITLFAGLFVVVMVCYAIWPRTDAWLIQLLNVVAMVYLLYQVMTTALSAHYPKPDEAVAIEAEAEFATALAAEPSSETNSDKEDMETLRQYARQVEEYLHTSGVYINPNLSLKDVAKATGISTNNLSKSINAVLGKNFFDLVNGFRVEMSKSLLQEKKEKGLTLETIAEKCGFNSRFTFNAAFKRATGMTTSQWSNSIDGS